MKLWWRIIFRIAIAMLAVFALWAFLFYRAVLGEMNDEVDDALEVTADRLIEAVLRGDGIPFEGDGTNNTYYIDTVSTDYVNSHPRIEYSNEECYIVTSDEEEAARVMRTTFQTDDDEWLMLTVALPTLKSEDLAHSVTCWSALLFALLLAIIIVICAWIIWLSMKPLYRLLHWMGRNDITREVEPLDNPTGISEFSRLNHAVFDATLRSKKSYEQQKQFIGNASHELQTPIAVCRNRLELLMDTPLSEEQMEQVVKTRQSLSYMARLNRELLTLSRIDNGQYGDCEMVAIDKMVVERLEDLQSIYESRSITVKQLIEPQRVSIHPVLAQILVNNLLKNAFLHNCNAGRIEVVTGGGCLCVSNSSDIASLQGKPIFQRFYHEGKNESSTGLGLALVDAIVKHYGFTLSYAYEAGLHCFKIKF